MIIPVKNNSNDELMLITITNSNFSPEVNSSDHSANFARVCIRSDHSKDELQSSLQ